MACSYVNDGAPGRGRRSGATAAAAAAASATANTNANATSTTNAQIANAPTGMAQSPQQPPPANPQQQHLSSNVSRTHSPGHDSVRSAQRSVEASPPGSKRSFSDEESKEEVYKRVRMDMEDRKPDIDADEERKEVIKAASPSETS